MKQLVVVAVLGIFVSVVRCKVVVEKIEQCGDATNYKIKFTSHLREEGGIQIAGGTLKTDIETGDNVENNVDIYTLDNGEFKFLINAKETWCNSLHNYMGDFGYDMQKAAGINPGTCPLPAGEYSIKDHPLDFSKFKFRDVPKGTLKMVDNILDLKTKEKLGCIEMQVRIEAD
ncbi:uncharacterized protein LOC123313506 [Coccinella septempunctata]|uniref:uncharacterized protein LOC123313506 n=1 Tax=Coccinella septempunctata TaxID=41139 RepID=UPI001D072642|nr:uncharacterized protein LOC123313506 [Coccinella septempunctata]